MNMKKIKGKYEYPADLKKEHVTGAFGGINPTGEFLLCFYDEEQTLPQGYEIQVDDQGQVASENTTPNEVSMNRRVVSRFVMSLETAKMLKMWLNQTLDGETGEESLRS